MLQKRPYSNHFLDNGGQKTRDFTTSPINLEKVYSVRADYERKFVTEFVPLSDFLKACNFSRI